MSRKLEGKVAVVTGASKGIGAGIAKGLAAEGAKVVVNYASSKEGAEEVVAEIAADGGKAIAAQGDVSKAADVRKLFATTLKEFGRVDVLVNNAGVYQFAGLDEITEEQFHRQFNTNVLGLMLATQEAARHFGAEGGSVINIGSVASSLTPPASVIYTATKGAVDAVTHVLAKELGPKKIRVNSINPGHGGDGRHALRWNHRQRLPEGRRGADPARSDRSARRHCTDRRISGIGGFRLADRRNLAGLRRPAITIVGRASRPAHAPHRCTPLLHPQRLQRIAHRGLPCRPHTRRGADRQQQSRRARKRDGVMTSDAV